MGVYLYPSGTETELKNAYIGEVYEYSYDFRNKTAAQIQQEFSLLTGGFVLNVNSDGITGSSSADCRIAKTIPSLANAKRITISGTFISSSNSATATSFTVGYGSGYGTSSTGGNYFGSGTSYPGIYISCKTNGTTVRGTSAGNITTSTTYKPTIIIDLENKSATTVLNGLTATLSLTDTQVNDIKNNYTQLIPYISMNRSTISDISLTIEY